MNPKQWVKKVRHWNKQWEKQKIRFFVNFGTLKDFCEYFTLTIKHLTNRKNKNREFRKEQKYFPWFGPNSVLNFFTSLK